MLLKDFYTVHSKQQTSDQSFSIYIRLNEKHPVFEGHFPGNPVTPGVCMMQIIKELTEEITGFELFLKNASNVKFMALINPEINPELRLDLDFIISEEEIKVKNTTYFEETTALKLTNTYRKIGQ